MSFLYVVDGHWMAHRYQCLISYKYVLMVLCWWREVMLRYQEDINAGHTTPQEHQQQQYSYQYCPIVSHQHTTIPHHTSLYITISHHTSSYLIIPHYTSPYTTIPHHISPCLTIDHHTLPYLTINHHLLLYFTVDHYAAKCFLTHIVPKEQSHHFVSVLHNVLQFYHQSDTQCTPKLQYVMFSLAKT